MLPNLTFWAPISVSIRRSSERCYDLNERNFLNFMTTSYTQHCRDTVHHNCDHHNDLQKSFNRKKENTSKTFDDQWNQQPNCVKTGNQNKKLVTPLNKKVTILTSKLCRLWLRPTERTSAKNSNYYIQYVPHPSEIIKVSALLVDWSYRTINITYTLYIMFRSRLQQARLHFMWNAFLSLVVRCESNWM